MTENESPTQSRIDTEGEGQSLDSSKNDGMKFPKENHAESSDRVESPSPPTQHRAGWESYETKYPRVEDPKSENHTWNSE